MKDFTDFESIPLHIQKLAVLRSFEILDAHYPALIKDKKVTNESANKHLDALHVALNTLDKLERGIDVRIGLGKLSNIF